MTRKVRVQQLPFSIIKIASLGEKEVRAVCLIVNFWFFEMHGDKEEQVVINMLSLSIF